MADQDQTGFSRVCPACERRVPRSVTTCRCGATLPVAEAASPEPSAIVEAEEPKGGSSLVLPLILAAMVGAGAAYWFLRPPPAQVAATEEAAEEEAAEPEAVAAPRSAAARAWDAAANARPLDAPLDDKTPVTPDPPASAASIEEMVDRVMPAVVLIEATGGRGSGFFVAYDTLITNVHVVQNDSYVTLKKSDGSTVSARVDSKAPAFDIAVLKVAQASPSQTVIPMGSSRSLRPGQEVIVIGSALGTLQNSVSRGIVSGLRNAGGATLVQTDAATNPGNSGGPMLDRNGSVIGITTMGYRGAEGLNFGVAIDHARDILEGRQPNLGSARGLTDIQSQSRGSESDRRLQQGEEQLREGVRQLAAAARDIDGGWMRFRKQCYSSPISGNYQREWFAVLVPRGIPDNAAAGCTAYFEAMQSDIKQFQGLMQRLVGDARRANVEPGTVRDMLRANKLEFDWDR